jgi:hypothetical protein
MRKASVAAAAGSCFSPWVSAASNAALFPLRFERITRAAVVGGEGPARGAPAGVRTSPDS